MFFLHLIVLLGFSLSLLYLPNKSKVLDISTLALSMSDRTFPNLLLDKVIPRASSNLEATV